MTEGVKLERAEMFKNVRDGHRDQEEIRTNDLIPCVGHRTNANLLKQVQ